MHAALKTLLALTGLATAFAVQAAKYTPPVEKDDGARPNAWFVKRSSPVGWCAYRSFAAAESAVSEEAAKEDYEGSETASIRYRGNRIEKVFVSNGSEDAVADDIYYLDERQRISKMVRTGHYITDPLFSVTYVPDATGKLVLVAASRTVVRRMNEARYEPYIVEWPTYSAFSDMPFHTLVRRGQSISIRWGCGPA